MSDQSHLTDRQKKWFASVLASLQRDTGRSLGEWAALARACPESAPRKRQAWMKTEFGLGVNYASIILQEAFPPDASWSTPDALAEALWRDDSARHILEAVKQAISSLPGIIVGQRKTFTAFSREFQFAAIKPVKQGALLGLRIPPTFDAALTASGKESWSERLKSKILLPAPSTVNDAVSGMLRASWEMS